MTHAFPALTKISKDAGRGRLPRSSCRSNSHASSNAVAVDEPVFQRGGDMRNQQERKRQHQPAVQRVSQQTQRFVPADEMIWQARFRPSHYFEK